MPASAALIATVEALWRVPRPGPENLLTAPQFVSLSELCAAEYGVDKPVFALNTALRSLGLPCQLPADKDALALDPLAAADAIDEACRRRSTIRRHLCPLDLADDLPELAFGSARVAQFSADALARMFNAPRIARTFPTQPLNAERLSRFQWLVVEEEIALDPRPEARAAPIMYMSFNRDFGEIEPHLGRFPPAVEASLFFLILAPWEEWSTMPEVDWRGFRVPLNIHVGRGPLHPASAAAERRQPDTRALDRRRRWRTDRARAPHAAASSGWRPARIGPLHRRSLDGA
jgi:hypothetical protein